jgi:predicted ATPase
VCAAFSSPRAAVDAAVAAQRGLELPVRMGVETGEAELRGSDYFGAVLNRAARVMSAGHGGQILLDGTTAVLLSDVDLMALGRRRLRDIAKPVEIFQVKARDLRTAFPPLKTADPIRGNLRPRTTSFIGRERELAELAEVLKSHDLVTLTGVGGVGKTRLALEAAARSADEFPDGVWVIELAPVGDPAAVPEAVAAVLGIAQQPGMSLAASVAAAMEDRSRLLVFDNCEHVLDAAADMIEAILARSETVKVLATSREGLRAEDEQLLPVPSLDMKAGAASPAAYLFVDRARTVARGISLAGNDDAVVEICERLDGIPLAIELAASRLLSMSVTDVRDHLDNRFRLLVGSRRGLERHQTLHHAVAWSYDLLGDAEKALLARCSVFAGGFDLGGAAAVSGSDDQFAVLDLLDALVRKSLVVVDRSADRTRFSMLETIRQFAEEQLAATGAAADTRAAHARYFAGRESDVLALWDGPRQRVAHDWFALEQANLRAAFRWAADNGELDTAVAVAFCGAFLGMWVEQYEPIAWCEEIIEPARAVGHRRLVQLYVAASQCYSTGRIDAALGYVDSAETAIQSGRFDELPDAFEAAHTATYIANGQPDRSIQLCRRMIAATPGRHPLAHVALVMALTIAGDMDQAVALSEDLLDDANAENPHVACFALLAYGMAQREADPAGATQALRRGLALARNSRSRQVESHLAVCLARVAAQHGDPVEVFELLTQAIHKLLICLSGPTF